MSALRPDPNGRRGPSRAADPIVGGLLVDVRGMPARELTELLARRIETGDLPAGLRLPTIRQVSLASGASVSSVANSWSRLVERGLVSTRRRGGTVVVGPSGAPGAPRVRERAFTGWATVDLVTAHPTADQLPPLGAAFERALREPDTHALQREHITDLLREVAGAGWPFGVGGWATVSGSGEATVVACEAAADGRPIAVQEPATPGNLANLRASGLTVIGVSSDAAGPEPDSLAAALRAGARTFLYQPGGAMTLGGRVGDERLGELAEVVRAEGEHAWVLEEEVLGGLAPAGTAATLGQLLPDRVARLVSYCRAFGLDLRTTVIGGPLPLVERLRQLRSHGAASQSRILQNALAHQLQDRTAVRQAAAAANRFERNAAALRAALADRGIGAVSPAGGLLVWVPADDEAQALAELAISGVNLAPSSRTHTTPPSRPMLRVATPQLPGPPHPDGLADLVAGVARAGVSPG